MYSRKYYEHIIKRLEEAIEREEGHIRDAAAKIVETRANGNTVHIFGCGHANMLSEEAYRRCGGLAVFKPIFAPGLNCLVKPFTLTTLIERTPEYGRDIADFYGIKKGDLIFIHSVAGSISVVIDMAIRCHELGAYVIGIISMEFAKESPSSHKSGKRLYDFCDLVIDEGVVAGEGSVEIEGLPYKVGPTSTVLGAALLNAIAVEAAGLFKEKGMVVPVLASTNISGGVEYNKEVLAAYKDYADY